MKWEKAFKAVSTVHGMLPSISSRCYYYYVIIQFKNFNLSIIFKEQEGGGRKHQALIPQEFREVINEIVSTRPVELYGRKVIWQSW